MARSAKQIASQLKAAKVSAAKRRAGGSARCPHITYGEFRDAAQRSADE